MSVIGIGVDLVECARIQRSINRFGDRFLHRVFTDGEIEYSMSMKFPARHLAARFAGKEAVSKAFGTGIGKAMGWRNIDIRKKESGEPFLVFSGPAQELAAKRSVTSALITLSHTEHHAVACVVLEGQLREGGTPCPQRAGNCTRLWRLISESSASVSPSASEKQSHLDSPP